MAKAPNYTKEQEATMKQMYLDVVDTDEDTRAETVAEIAAMFSKSPASVRAKLSRMDIYVAKQPKSKVTDGAPQKKEALAAELATVTSIPLVSAEKLNKTDLVALIAFAKAATETED